MATSLPVLEAPTPGTDVLAPPLADAQGRVITYLRLSLTDRCNFRCTYCSPASWAGRSALLEADEIVRLVSLFARMGVRRVRLTGGEPTVRKDLVDIVRGIKALPGIAEVCMTSNGFLLPELAKPLFDAGMTHVNVSIDTLDAGRFRAVTKTGELQPVLDGIDACLAAGFHSVKLNTVVLAGVNDGEVPDLIRFAWAKGVVPRFIECMPFAEGKPVPTLELVEKVRAAGIALEPEEAGGCSTVATLRGKLKLPAGPSEYWKGEGGLVGFIGPLTRNFCASCNRVRVAANGDLRACLGGRDRVPLSTLIRGGAADEDLARAIRAALANKPDGHTMTDPNAREQLLSMMGIGG